MKRPSFLSRVIVLLACVLLAPRAARANGTLDQTSPNGPYLFDMTTSTNIWQAQIQAGLTGTLAGVSITLQGAMGGQVDIRIRKGTAPSAQPVLFQQHVTQTAASWTDQVLFVDMTSAAIPLAEGDLFVMELQGNNTGMYIGGIIRKPAERPSYPQPLYLNGSIYPGGRVGFMTYVACSPGPPCKAADACHSAGVCDPTTGTCTSPPVPDGTFCDDGNACTHVDTCIQGTCVGGMPAVCARPAACQHGVCDPTTGMCTFAPSPDNTACNGGICISGVCQFAQQGDCGLQMTSAPVGDATFATTLALAALFARRRLRTLRNTRVPRLPR
jgi:hypothetical protein